MAVVVAGMVVAGQPGKKVDTRGELEWVLLVDSYRERSCTDGWDR